MDKSVAELKIEHYRKLLAADLDAEKREAVEAPLAAEEAELARIKSERAAAKSGRK